MADEQVAGTGKYYTCLQAPWIRPVSKPKEVDTVYLGTAGLLIGASPVSSCTPQLLTSLRLEKRAVSRIIF